MDIENNFVDQSDDSVELLSVEEKSTEETCEVESSVEDSTEEIIIDEVISESDAEIICECVYNPEDLVILHEDLGVIHNDLQVIACICIVLVVFKILALCRILIDAIF